MNINNNKLWDLFDVRGLKLTNLVKLYSWVNVYAFEIHLDLVKIAWMGSQTDAGSTYASFILMSPILADGDVIFPAVDSNEIIANISNPRKNNKRRGKDGFVKIFSNKIVLTELEMLDGHCFDLIGLFWLLGVK